MEGYGDFQVAGFYVQEVVLLGLGSESTAADLFDNPYSVVRINYPIPDVEITVTIAAHTGNSPPRDSFILHDWHRLSQFSDMTTFTYQWLTKFPIGASRLFLSVLGRMNQSGGELTRVDEHPVYNLAKP